MTIKKTSLTAVCALVGWVLLLALVTRFTSAAPSVRVLFPSLSFIMELPPVSILNKNSWSITLQSNDANLVASLYQKGALLVLPSGLHGCLPRP